MIAIILGIFEELSVTFGQPVVPRLLRLSRAEPPLIVHGLCIVWLCFSCNNLWGVVDNVAIISIASIVAIVTASPAISMCG